MTDFTSAPAIAGLPDTTPEHVFVAQAEDAQKSSASTKSRGLGYAATIFLETLVFAGVMAVDVTLNKKVTAISQYGIIAVAALFALLTKRTARLAAFWAPPIVWLLAIETAGQIGTDFTKEDSKTQATHLAYGLADHAIWIGAAWLAAGLVVAIRRIFQRSS